MKLENDGIGLTERSNLGGMHPLVSVAAGSHASYFQYVSEGYFVTVPGFIIPFLNLRLRITCSATRVDALPDADQQLPVRPRVEMLPDPIGPADLDDPIWKNKKWLSFPGSWGMRFLGGLAYGGPTGPRHKGLIWHHPFAWMERYCTPDFLVY